MHNRYWGFIKDPIYGYIKVTELEKDVIDQEAFQRLRRIKQLCGAEYVYPAANHSRFEHSLGVMHLAGLAAQNLPIQLSEDDIAKLRLAGLLHDVGHGPFSHVFEPLLYRFLGKTHEDMTVEIVKGSSIADVIEDHGFDSKEMSLLAIGRCSKLPTYMNQVIHGTVDVDKLDFLVRDSYHTGAGYGSIDIYRLIYTFGVIDDELAVDYTALPTLESFLLARIQSFRTIYYHKVSRAVQIMLGKAIELAAEDVKAPFFKNIEEYIALDDYVMWSVLLEHEDASKIVKDIASRRLLKCAYERLYFIEDRLLVSLLANESVRRRIESEIASIAGLEQSMVFVDAPSLPSVPYARTMEMEAYQIPVFRIGLDGTINRYKLAEASQLVSLFKSFMNIVRVYTYREYRDRVYEASRKVLGSPTLSELISY
ncbi:MAG: HD domain-containing protein [Nitrososphaerota archaeon]|nr:HD domain-containing protein [Candidatus Bathyarchaeota archaeon]MDW8061972.1 HD domain-containing protein [Nitrososphaerota archaeon]